jgi:predicted transcriptional regulator
MQVRSPELFQKLEKMAQHYQNNVASTYLKAEIASLTLSRRDWDEVELITARQEVFRHQGYHLDELYLKLLSLARLIHQARSHMAPGLKSKVANRLASRSPQERLMAEMAAANFLPNVAVLAEMVLDLYRLAVHEDEAQNHGKAKFLASVPEAKETETLLKG